MVARYFELSTEELEAERDKQAEVVSAATPEEFINQWHKLSAIKNMLDWRAVEAARFGGGKRSARKPKVSARQQAGRFEYGRNEGFPKGGVKDRP